MANLELAARATAMRNAPTEPEKRLWRHLSNGQLGNFKFRRQAVIPPYIADFLCPAHALVVEIDGDTHEAQADERRDTFLRSKGYHVLRFTNHDVIANMPGVLETILATATALPPRWPHPNPSPEGEGLRQAAPSSKGEGSSIARAGTPPLQRRGRGGEQRRNKAFGR